MPGFIMGSDEADLVRLRSGLKIFPATWSFSSARSRKTSTGAGTCAIPATPSRTCSGIPSINGWRRHWTAWLTPGTRYSRPNSCCPGRSRRRRRGKAYGATATQHVGRQWRAVDHHGGREMGRNDRSCRPTVPAPSAYRREEVLAVRGEQGGAPAVRCRAAKPRLEAVRIVDMSASNSWAEFSATYRRTHWHTRNRRAPTSKSWFRRTPRRRSATV
jgi:hypothetical protein